jgi:hypothetical protein
MNALDRLSRELDTLLSDIAFSGVKNIHPEIIDKLARLEGTAKELGMEKGAALMNQFAGALRNYRLAGEGNEPVLNLLCALDFYNKNVMGNLQDMNG